MIDVVDFMPIKVRHLPIGSLFVPTKAGDEHFLAGRINETAVLITLDGEEPFRVAETDEWTAVRRGVNIPRVRFEVELNSLFTGFSEDEAPPGSLVRSAGATGMIGFDRHQRYTVWLLSSEDRGFGQDDIAFSKWQIVVGSEPNVTVLFSHQGKSRSQHQQA